MPRVHLDVDDDAVRVTLRYMLEADGFAVSSEGYDVVIVDDFVRAESMATAGPVLLLVPSGKVAEAVAVMRRGVYGYVIVPLVPGEATVMVGRAVGAGGGDGESELRTLEHVERDTILETLRRCQYNRAKAARVLGIGRNTLWRKLRRIESEEE
ncbi:MAG: hypothetical protein GY851_10300 [bacterium]|nr:hypothetical protein [bacterium]